MFKRLCVLVLMLVFIPLTSFANEEFMGLAEVEKLLTRGPVLAYFKTVSEGTTLQTYPITLKGVWKEMGMPIVVFTSKSFVVAGMSGSPVYVKSTDGKEKLLGALSYKLGEFMVGDQWGGITLITAMFAEESKSLPQVLVLGEISTRDTYPESFQYQDMTFISIPLGTMSVPPSVSDEMRLDASTVRLLQKKNFIMSTAPVQSTTATLTLPAKPNTLKAGMPIYVDLIDWEVNGKLISLGAMGTVTYISPEGRVYAFGHPFLKARSVKYLFRTCSVIGSVISEYDSFKIAGEKSEVLGAIQYDGSFGIYGTLGQHVIGGLKSIHVVTQKDAGPKIVSKITLARTPITQVLLAMTFSILGGASGAPMDDETSATEMAAVVSLAGHEPIKFSQSSSCTRQSFGPFLFNKSSYTNAYQKFLSDVYLPLSTSQFNFDIQRLDLSFKFFSRAQQTLALASFRFPNKISYKTNPVLELLLVNDDNTARFVKRVVVPIEWSKVEEPIYTVDTKDTEKKGEKTVNGRIELYTVESFKPLLSDSERNQEEPKYFLNATDFLTFFKKSLARTNQRLFAKLYVQRRSGLLDAAILNSDSLIPSDSHETEGWQLIPGGLQERRIPLLDELFIPVIVELPPIPAGYIISGVKISTSFEIVK